MDETNKTHSNKQKLGALKDKMAKYHNIKNSKTRKRKKYDDAKLKRKQSGFVNENQKASLIQLQHLDINSYMNKVSPFFSQSNQSNHFSAEHSYPFHQNLPLEESIYRGPEENFQLWESSPRCQLKYAPKSDDRIHKFQSLHPKNGRFQNLPGIENRSRRAKTIQVEEKSQVRQQLRVLKVKTEGFKDNFENESGTMQKYTKYMQKKLKNFQPCSFSLYNDFIQKKDERRQKANHQETFITTAKQVRHLNEDHYQGNSLSKNITNIELNPELNHFRSTPWFNLIGLRGKKPHITNYNLQYHRKKMLSLNTKQEVKASSGNLKARKFNHLSTRHQDHSHSKVQQNNSKLSQCHMFNIQFNRNSQDELEKQSNHTNNFIGVKEKASLRKNNNTNQNLSIANTLQRLKKNLNDVNKNKNQKLRDILEFMENSQIQIKNQQYAKAIL